MPSPLSKKPEQISLPIQNAEIPKKFNNYGKLSSWQVKILTGTTLGALAGGALYFTSKSIPDFKPISWLLKRQPETSSIVSNLRSVIGLLVTAAGATGCYFLGRNPEKKAFQIKKINLDDFPEFQQPVRLGFCNEKTKEAVGYNCETQHDFVQEYKKRLDECVKVYKKENKIIITSNDACVNLLNNFINPMLIEDALSARTMVEISEYLFENFIDHLEINDTINKRFLKGVYCTMNQLYQLHGDWTDLPLYYSNRITHMISLQELGKLKQVSSHDPLVLCEIFGSYYFSDPKEGKVIYNCLTEEEFINDYKTNIKTFIETYTNKNKLIIPSEADATKIVNTFILPLLQMENLSKNEVIELSNYFFESFIEKLDTNDVINAKFIKEICFLLIDAVQENLSYFSSNFQKYDMSENETAMLENAYRLVLKIDRENLSEKEAIDIYYSCLLLLRSIKSEPMAEVIKLTDYLDKKFIHQLEINAGVYEAKTPEDFIVECKKRMEWFIAEYNKKNINEIGEEDALLILNNFFKPLMTKSWINHKNKILVIETIKNKAKKAYIPSNDNEIPKEASANLAEYFFDKFINKVEINAINSEFIKMAFDFLCSCHPDSACKLLLKIGRQNLLSDYKEIAINSIKPGWQSKLTEENRANLEQLQTIDFLEKLKKFCSNTFDAQPLHELIERKKTGEMKEKAKNTSLLEGNGQTTSQRTLES
jgi:hypothetical protein